MIYRFKVWFDEEEDVVRWIDMKPSHTFLDFHKQILASIKFEDLDPASFFTANDRWIKGFEVTLEDMGFDDSDEPKTLMKDTYLKDFVNDPHQKFIYINDFIEMWTLHIELFKIMDDEKGVTYPRLYKSEGTAPKQKEGAGKFSLLDDAEFDMLANEIIMEKGGRMPDLSGLIGTDFDDEVVENDDDDDDDADEFGPSYGDGLDEDSQLY